MELEKNKLSINQIIAQKLDTAICEGDCIVPDIKPDIFSIITSSGIVNIYKKEVMDGKVRIDGAVNTYTMYIAEEEGKREIIFFFFFHSIKRGVYEKIKSVSRM